MKFCSKIEEKKIKAKDIFFTDEKRFVVEKHLNPQTNQIRLTARGLKELKEGDGEIYEKLAKPLPKFATGVMIAGGLSSRGVGKLIFCVGTMNSFSYAQALKMYNEDIQRLGGNLIFQQDNASAHTSKAITII